MLNTVLVVCIDQFFVFLAHLLQRGQEVNHDVSGFEFRLQVSYLFFVFEDDFVEKVELCLYAKLGIFGRLLFELVNEGVDFCDFFLVLSFFEEESVFFKEEQVDPVEAFEVVVGCVEELVVFVLHDSL